MAARRSRDAFSGTEGGGGVGQCLKLSLFDHAFVYNFKEKYNTKKKKGELISNSSS